MSIYVRKSRRERKHKYCIVCGEPIPIGRHGKTCSYEHSRENQVMNEKKRRERMRG